MTSIKLSNIAKVFWHLSLVISLVCVTACDGEKKSPQKETGTGAIVGVNYTGNGVQWFTIDDAGGGRIGSYGGGGGSVCCTDYPKQWRPDLKVTVKWERSDGREPNSDRLKLVVLEKVVPIEKYTEAGDVYVLFLPDDEVKVYVAITGVGNPDFPDHYGYPEDAEKIEKTTP